MTHAQTWASYSALYRFGRLSGGLILKALNNLLPENQQKSRKVFRISTVRYHWPMSAHASQAFSIASCTDLEDLPKSTSITGAYAVIGGGGVSSFLFSPPLLFIHSCPLPSLFPNSFPFSPLPLSVGPLNHLGSVGERCNLPQQGLAKNEFGALLSCQKATGGSHFECSEVYVLQ